MVESGKREFFNPKKTIEEIRPLIEEISSKENVHIHAFSVGAYTFAMAQVSAKKFGIPLDSITSIIWLWVISRFHDHS